MIIILFLHWYVKIIIVFVKLVFFKGVIQIWTLVNLIEKARMNSLHFIDNIIL